MSTKRDHHFFVLGRSVKMAPIYLEAVVAFADAVNEELLLIWCGVQKDDGAVYDLAFLIKIPKVDGADDLLLFLLSPPHAALIMKESC